MNAKKNRFKSWLTDMESKYKLHINERERLRDIAMHMKKMFTFPELAEMFDYIPETDELDKLLEQSQSVAVTLKCKIKRR